ncbi:MAG: hypothetical protein KH359_10430 [Clostridiales bacterium]|nr:hypothetical protein [Clostridiales bacterium]
MCGWAGNFGIRYSTLTEWVKDFGESDDIQVRGCGGYLSDKQKELCV